jgi:hypothetical protein
MSSTQPNSRGRAVYGEAQEYEQYAAKLKRMSSMQPRHISTLATLELILLLNSFFHTFKPPKFDFVGLLTHSTIHLGNLLIYFHYFNSIFFVLYFPLIYFSPLPFLTSAPSSHYPKLKKKTPWLVVRKRTIPTERPPLVSEVYPTVYISYECVRKRVIIFEYT